MPSVMHLLKICVEKGVTTELDNLMNLVGMSP